MAQKGLQLDQETFSCSICLDLLNDPVTLACGHNYCMKCISIHWYEKEIYSCPQCRQTFTPRPVLAKNTMLAAVAEQLKNTELQDSLADVCYAGPKDVACDVCTGRKLKAVKSCLRCLVSFCEEHLQPHHHVDQYKKHQLVKPSKKLKERTTITETVTKLDALLLSPSPAPPEPRTRAGFLKYSRVLTLDPGTAGSDLVLSQGDRRATLFHQNQIQPSNFYRNTYGSQTQCFSDYCQVLSKEILTDRSYWEVVWSGRVEVSVAYEDILWARCEKECELGRSNRSWSLRCFNDHFELYHNDIVTPVSGPLSSRVGVYLDHKAGILSFYSICFETMTLLHRVRTKFTGPLSAGFRILNSGDTVKVCDPKQPFMS